MLKEDIQLMQQTTASTGSGFLLLNKNFEIGGIVRC